MAVIRLGAVDYLNARPLVHGLERRRDLFALRFDPPSQCADAAARGRDRRRHDSVDRVSARRRAVPASSAAWASCRTGRWRRSRSSARRPIGEIRSIAVDTSSRTSTGLLRVLCRETFGIEPEFVPMPPAIEAMLERCDAALVIGDPALYLDHQAAGLAKIDLGEQWTSLTGLPFVWAFWAGRPGVLSRGGADARSATRATRAWRRRTRLPTRIAGRSGPRSAGPI